MEFGLLAPALIGVALTIVGIAISMWMNSHKPTLELPSSDKKQFKIPSDLDKAGRKTNYAFAFRLADKTVEH